MCSLQPQLSPASLWPMKMPTRWPRATPNCPISALPPFGGTQGRGHIPTIWWQPYTFCTSHCTLSTLSPPHTVLRFFLCCLNTLSTCLCSLSRCLLLGRLTQPLSSLLFSSSCTVSFWSALPHRFSLNVLCAFMGTSTCLHCLPQARFGVNHICAHIAVARDLI